MKVTAQVRKLYSVLSCIPPDFEMAETLIAMHQPSEEEMMWLAVELAENTFGEYGDALVGGNLSAVQVRLHRDYLYDTVHFLLEHGMNPNTIVDQDTTETANIMADLRFTEGPDMAARTMRLLLEHGGDPNLEGCTLTPMIWMEMELHIDPIYERLYCDNLVQCLLVMQAYGGRFDDGTVPFVMRDGLGSEIFKEFEKFDYQFGNEEGAPGYIHVFERTTRKIVADYV